MKRFVCVLGAALAVPSTALAKEVQSVSVCGANGCKAMAGAVAAFRDTFEGQGTANEPRTVLDAVPVAPFYKIGIRIRGDQPPVGQFSLVMWYVRPNLIRFAGGLRDTLSEPFKEIPASLAAQLESASQTLQPYPAPRVMKAYVNDKVVANPRPYIGLFGRLASTDATTDSGQAFVNIALTPDRANPWFASGVSLLYLNDVQSLFLAKPLLVSDRLADRIAQDAGLRSPVHRSSSWAHPVKLGILIGWLPIVIAVGIAVTWRRHRPRSA
jgi:hypothetical protein